MYGTRSTSSANQSLNTRIDLKILPEDFFSVNNTWSTEKKLRRKMAKRNVPKKNSWARDHLAFVISISLFFFIIFLALAISLGLYLDALAKSDPTLKCPDDYSLPNCERSDFEGFLYWEKSIGYKLNGNLYYYGMSYRVYSKNSTKVSVYIKQDDESHLYSMTNQGDGYWYLFIVNIRNDTSFYYDMEYNGEHYKRYSIESFTLSPYDLNPMFDSTYSEDIEWNTYKTITLKAKEKLVFYTLHVPTFNSDGYINGTFSSIIPRLNYLKLLGINCIILLPIEPLKCDITPSYLCWYNYYTLFPGKIHPSFGSIVELKKLVYEIHKLGMHIVIEIDWSLFSEDMFLVNYDGSSKNNWGEEYMDIYKEDNQPNGLNRIRGTVNSRGNSFFINMIHRYNEIYGIDGVYMKHLLCQRLYGKKCNEGEGEDNTEMNELLATLTSYKSMYYVGLADDSLNVSHENSSIIDVTNTRGNKGLGFTIQFDKRFTNQIYSLFNTSSISMTSLANFIQFEYLYSSSSLMFSIETPETAILNRFRVQLNSNNPDDIYTIKDSILALYLMSSTPAIPNFFMGTEYMSTLPFGASPSPLDLNNVGEYNYGAWITKGPSYSYFILTKDLLTIRSDYTQMISSEYSIYYTNSEKNILAMTKGSSDSAQLTVVINTSKTSYDDGTLFVDFPPLSGKLWKMIFNSDDQKYNELFTGIGGNVVLRQCPQETGRTWTYSSSCGNVRIGAKSILIYSSR
ncbi:hypothetical protein WA158_001809 [Blastocystis sp. Blastoise]